MKDIVLIFLCVTSFGYGQVTMQFSTVGAALTNLSNSTGASGTNNLVWGILVDSEGNGFGNLKADLSAPYMLTSGAELTLGDFFFYSGTTLTFPLGVEAGQGAATTTVSMDVYSIPEISVGDPFALIWFDTGINLGDSLVPGTNYGILTDPTFTLPSNGSSNQPYSSIFAGPDPIRPANLAVGMIFPQISQNFVANRIAASLEIEIATVEGLTFDIESSTTGKPNDWTEQSVIPEIISDDGTKRTIQLVHPSTTLDETELLIRLIATP